MEAERDVVGRLGAGQLLEAVRVQDEQVEEEATMDALLQVAERVREYPMMVEEFLARDGDELG